jgi:hypothetical protein
MAVLEPPRPHVMQLIDKLCQEIGKGSTRQQANDTLVAICALLCSQDDHVTEVTLSAVRTLLRRFRADMATKQEAIGTRVADDLVRRSGAKL